LTPLLLALGASLAWGVADFAGPLLSRTLGALRVLFWAQVGGVAAMAIVIGVRADGPAGAGVLFAIGAGVCGTAGLYAYYRGMQVGAMSVVAPIAGVSAVIPVVYGIATGDSPSAWQIAGMVAALAGVGLASVEHQEGERRIATGVGRPVELGPAPLYRPTDEGRLLGHVHLGLRLIEERASGLDAEVRAQLLHAVAVHHDGRAARTAEAAVLYHANQLDAIAATRPTE